VKVALDASTGVFKPEMLVDVTFLAPKAPDSMAIDSGAPHLFVPQQLVFQDEMGPFVWVADQSDGVARKTAITTGSPGVGGLVEVTSGLTIGSRVIARGHESLADGQRIEVIDEDPGSFANSPTATGQEQPLRRLPHSGD
jgi:multidrug efflux pump subunit AcrA (membrane-fusion protein)